MSFRKLIQGLGSNHSGLEKENFPCGPFAEKMAPHERDRCGAARVGQQLAALAQIQPCGERGISGNAGSATDAGDIGRHERLGNLARDGGVGIGIQ